MAIPAITLRNSKGSALTFTEMDTNLQNLANANVTLTAGGTTTTIALNSGFTLSPGSGIDIANSSGNVTITNLNPNVATYSGNITAKSNGYTLGYLEMPQVASGNVTLALTDSGKHYYDTSTAVTTITIPVNSSVAFPLGTVISFVNNSIGNLVISQGSATLYQGGNATTGSRTITAYGVATLMKVATDTWYINGSGVV